MDSLLDCLPDQWNPRTRRSEGTTLPRVLALPKRPVGRKPHIRSAAERRKARDLVMLKCLDLGLEMADIVDLTGLSAKQVLRRLRVMLLAAKAIRRRQDNDAAAVARLIG